MRHIRLQEGMDAEFYREVWPKMSAIFGTDYSAVGLFGAPKDLS